ncbi:MAG: RNA methyltransferase [Lachnospiraceae bacterium]|nr:RNA methyltransferase [Lachnospiraceae bacterium]
MLNIIPVFDLSLPELSFYTTLSEVQLLRYYEPDTGLFLAESPNVIQRAINAGYEPISFLVEHKYLFPDPHPILVSFPSIPIYTADLSLLSKITGFPMTRGMLSVFKRKAPVSYREICSSFERIVVLEHIMNPTNIGAIFRSAAALNMEAVLLTSDCCDPLYKRSTRVSMGTVFQIPWTFISDSYIDDLKQSDFKLVSMALTDTSVSITSPELLAEKKLAIFMGSESTGLKDSTIQASDYIVKIPMAHGVDSLNVAAASAIAFWQLGQPHN